jgi:predicted permease
MSWWKQFRARFRSQVRRELEDRDLEQEIRFHLEEEERLRIGRGEPEGRAREAARRDFGNVALVKEVTRQMWGWHSIETLFQDVSYGLRQLRHSPGFTAVAVITLALGIGANTAIFSIVNSFLLRPLPVPDAERITAIAFQQKSGPLRSQLSVPDFEDIRRQSTGVFTDVIAYSMGLDGLAVDGKSSHIWSNYVSGNYFETLGVRPALGRLILPSEGKHAGEDPVLVLGYSYWKQRFAGDTSIIGKKVSVNGRPVTIIGVAPAEFHGLKPIIDTQGYLPLGMWAIEADSGDFLNDRALRGVNLFGRLRPEISLQRAQTDFNVIAARLSKTYPKTDEGLSFRLFRERSARPEPTAADGFATIATLFLNLTALVLLLASINVANILLVRASVRQREMALRAALGAGRIRLLRQLLTESLLLALLGGIGGVLLGMGLSNAIGSVQLDTPIPILLDFHFDWTVFAFAFGTALVAGAVIGLIPAWRSSRTDLVNTLHQGGRSVAVGRTRLRSSLVVVQVAGSLMLLIAAALFTRSLHNAQQVDLGFDPNHVVNLTFDVNEAGYTEAQGRKFSLAVLDRVRAIPGVESASLAYSVPMGYYNAGSALEIPDYQPPAGMGAPSLGYNVVSTDYFSTMRIPILRGRDFTDGDTGRSQHVAVINQAMAKRFWPGRDAIGRKFRMMDDSQHIVEVVGIARNSRASGFRGPIPPYMYVSIKQVYGAIETLQVRTARTPATLLPELRKIVEGMEPGMPLFSGQTMVQALSTINGLLSFQVGATLAAGLGVLGLALALVGLYGVVSYAAAQRTHEIGIRMALGARAGQILKMIVRQGLIMVSAGLGVGLLAAWGLSHLVSGFLVGVSGTDPLIFAMVTLLLGVVALAACYLPARRATRVDPMTALRLD